MTSEKENIDKIGGSNKRLMARFRTGKKSRDLGNRLEATKALYIRLEKEIETLRQSGEIAEAGCWIVRYQARGNWVT